MGAMNHAIFAVLFGISLYLLKKHMNGGICSSTATIPGKVVVITGANTGIGKETATDLLKRGGKVYMACRSLQRAKEAAEDIIKTSGVNKENLITMKLDLGSIKSIRDFVTDFKKREKKLDILINNAGVMYVPEGTRTEDGFEATFGVNHLGHFLLTNLLMEEILAAAPSRIVTVSSKAHKYGSGTIKIEDPMLTSEWSTIYAYSQSKLANIIFSEELGKRLKDTGVTTYSLHPGAVQTELIRYIPVIGNKYVFVVANFLTWPFMKDPWNGAQTQICCAVDEKLETETGKFYADCVEAKPGAFDEDLSNELWDLSVKLLKMKDNDIHPKLR